MIMITNDRTHKITYDEFMRCGRFTQHETGYSERFRFLLRTILFLLTPRLGIQNNFGFQNFTKTFLPRLGIQNNFVFYLYNIISRILLLLILV